MYYYIQHHIDCLRINHMYNLIMDYQNIIEHNHPHHDYIRDYYINIKFPLQQISEKQWIWISFVLAIFMLCWSEKAEITYIDTSSDANNDIESRDTTLSRSKFFFRARNNQTTNPHSKFQTVKTFRFQPWINYWNKILK